MECREGRRRRRQRYPPGFRLEPLGDEVTLEEEQPWTGRGGKVMRSGLRIKLEMFRKPN